MFSSKFFFPFILTTLFFIGCRSEESELVDQDTIYTTYELFYNANQDITYARAWFRFGNALGTPLRLSDPSEVTFNGNLLTFIGELSYYEKEFSGFISNGTFEFTDIKGEKYENSITTPVITFASDIDTISRNSSYELFWTGGIILENERVGVFVNGENENDAQVATTNDIGSESIILPKNNLEQIGKGPGIIYMDRTYEIEVIQGTSKGGRIRGRYRAENEAVYFK